MWGITSTQTLALEGGEFSAKPAEIQTQSHAPPDNKAKSGKHFYTGTNAQPVFTNENQP